MSGLGQTTAQLARQRRLLERFLKAAAAAGPSAAGEAATGRLREVIGFGSNPGNLRMFVHVPERLPADAPLVVVLHGCTQTAAGYDLGAGWSMLADRYGFALLLPEQQRDNNPQGCFNWFRPEDTRRGRGEALSVEQMVARMLADHPIDSRRVFVTGLSAGGAMAAAMLATYPDVFAGGAVLAGLPYGCASDVQEALDCMFQGRSRPAREWGDLVRAASPHRGPWPKLSVWHGSLDTTVVPANAEELVKQWIDLHGLGSTPSATDEIDGYPHRVWRNSQGEAVIEAYTITGMAHGTPVAPGRGEAPHGAAAPFMLDVGIASSYHIAKFWGLTQGRAGLTQGRAERPAADARLEAAAPRDGAAEPSQPERPAEPAGPAAGDAGRAGRTTPLALDPQEVIARALGAAGLLRDRAAKFLGRHRR